jgi:hypothetical protein
LSVFYTSRFAKTQGIKEMRFAHENRVSSLPDPAMGKGGSSVELNRCMINEGASPPLEVVRAGRA